MHTKKAGDVLFRIKAQSLDILLIKIFFLLTPFIFGLFYEFASYLAQILILAILSIKLIKTKKCKLYLNWSSLMLAVISAGYLFTCIYAVDKGMAILGFLKFTIPLTFGFLLMQYSKEETIEMMSPIPIAGAIMVMLSVLFKYIPFLPNEFYLANGRMMGFFQYSNTFALFLLIGIIYTGYCKQSKIKVIIYNIVLLLGIFISGCRTVLILAFFNSIIMIIKQKELRIYFIALVIIAIASTIGYVAITGKVNTIGRYLTTSFFSMSLQERLLYYKDAIPLSLKHPFGLGYMGYSYMQPKIQTGIYQATFIHNDYLQLMLDIGIIPTIFVIIAIFKSLFDKENSIMLKQILLTIALHIFIDFDLQFLYMFCIFIITLNIWSGRKYEFNINKKAVISIASVICIVYLYFGIASFLYHIDKNKIASKMYPYYTQANIEIADEYMEKNDIKNANEYASKILNVSKASGLAYNVKSYYYVNNGNWNLMSQNKEKNLEFNKYDMASYEEYVLMLSQAIEYYAQKDEMEKATEYIKKVAEVPSKIEQVKSSTSSISYKLKDVPKFELSANVQNYIFKMKGVLEND